MGRPTDDPQTWATTTNYSAGSDPWSGNPTKSSPSGGVIAVGFTPQQYVPAQWMNYIMNNHGDWLKYLQFLPLSVQGITGNVIVSSGYVPSGNMTTNGGAGKFKLTGDFVCGNLQINDAVTLDTNGFRIYCGDTFQTMGSATLVRVKANDASGLLPGNATTVGTLLGGAAGGTGALGGLGSPTSGGSTTNSFGGAGGGRTSGTNGGSATAPTAHMGSIYVYSPSTFGYLAGALSGVISVFGIQGGAGGGGGASAVTGDDGGGGGGGGGVMAIAAGKIIINTNTNLQAFGGNGATATFSGPSNGGGGGGGSIILVSYYATCSNGSLSGATNCAGGTPGQDLTIYAATSGSAGTVYNVLLGNAT